MGRERALVAFLFIAAAAIVCVHGLPTARAYYTLGQVVQSGPARPQYDLWQYYAAGHNWRAGYDPYRVYHDMPGGLQIPRSRQISGYIYPPLPLPLLGQLSRLSYEAARAVWLVVSLLLLLTPVVIGVLLAPGRRWLTLALATLLLAASDPVLFHIRQGQIDMIVAGLAISGFLLRGRWRSWPSAVLLAAAIGLKLTPLVVVFSAAAYYRDWRLLLKTALAGLALVAVTSVWVAPGLYAEYVSRVLPLASGGNPFFHNQSLLRGWSHLDEWAKYASLALYALVVAVAGAAGPAAEPRASDGAGLRSRDLQVMAFSVLGILLFSPLAWRMTYVWCVPALALVIAAAPWEGRRWQLVLVAAGAALTCLPVWDHPVLDSLETIGASLAAVGLVAALLGPRLAARRQRLSTQKT